MSTTLPYRYPGPQPFSTEQEHLFFGREKAKRELYRLVQFEPLVLLYSRSGMGKSSLINAGIIPTAQRDNKLEPLPIRFQAYTEGKIETPQSITLQALQAGVRLADENLLLKIFPDDLSLWYAAKVRALQQATNRQLLLIFDQFEELFSYPPSAVESFAKELGELLNTELPQRIRRMEQLFLQAQPDLLSETERDLLHQPMQVRVLLAIRSDRMSLLDKLTPFVPQILGKRYELKSLSDVEAQDAMLCPAQDENKEYASPVFEYEEAAIQTILHYLKKDVKQEIESVQLQIICSSLEEKLIENNWDKISQADIGDLEKVFKEHYRTQIARIGTAEEQRIARKLIEEDLIFAEEERRLSLYEGQILRKPGMSEALLLKLENTYLIRREPSMQGGYSYELSHDTLVKPALEARTERHAEELREAEKAENQRRMAELVQLKAQAEEERRKRRRATILAVAAGVLAMVATVVGIWAFALNQQANAQKTVIQNNLTELTKKEEALQKSLAIAEAAQDTAEMRRLEAELAKTEAQRQAEIANLATVDAQKNLAKATQANERVAASLLKDVDKHILNLEYDQALEKTNAAAGLTAEKKVIFPLYLEIAFWYGEIGQTRRAAGILNTAATFIGKGSTSTFLAALAQAKQDYVVGKSPARQSPPSGDLGGYYASLLRRYYPYLVPIKGGTFEMGCDSVKLKQAYREDSNCGEDETLHTVTLSDYSLAETETTWWQFGLYRAATGKNVWEDRPTWLPTGDHPVVNVTWYDAIEYANWVTQQFVELQKDTAYTGDLRSKEVQVDWMKKGFRLPTEAEWEYAAGAGGKDLFAGTSVVDELYRYANYSSDKDGYPYTAPVKKYRPNTLGLYDLSGNVWEWCQDWYADYPTPPSGGTGGLQNPLGAKSGNYRVVRGGSWNNYDYNCRVSNRDDDSPNYRYYYYGFRLSGR